MLTGDGDLYFGLIAIYSPENQFLISDLNVENWFMNGNGTYTLELANTPRANGRKQLLDKLYFHHKVAGAYSWVFDGVTSSDCDFVFVNTTAVDPNAIFAMIILLKRKACQRQSIHC